MKKPSIISAKLVYCLTLLLTAQADQENIPTAASGTERSVLAQQLVAARSLAALDHKNEDPVTELWSCLNLRMPGLAGAALENARRQMDPEITPVFEAEIAVLQSSQNSLMAEIRVICLRAQAGHEVFNASVSELRHWCGGRLWTNASESVLSAFGATNILPVCEVRIPLEILKNARSDGSVPEIEQTLHFVAEVANLRIISPVVNLTDAGAGGHVQFRCLGMERLRGKSIYQMRRGVLHVFGVTNANTPQSTAAVQSVLEDSIRTLCVEAAAFSFPKTNSPAK